MHRSDRYIGSIGIAAWGIAHIVPTKPVVAGFGPLSADNRRILTMEWVAEGMTLAFIGVLCLLATLLVGPDTSGAKLVYRASAVMLLIMACWTLHELVGVTVLVAGLIAWLGQALAFLAPGAAVRLGVLEPEEEFDETLRVVEAKAMGLSDLLLAWMLPGSAGLMLMDHASWPYLALIGSGVFLYFSTVIVLSRLYLGKAQRRVGRPASRRAAYVLSAIWVGCSVGMIYLAVVELAGTRAPAG